MNDSVCSRCKLEGKATIELDFGDGKCSWCMACLSGKAISLYGSLVIATETIKQTREALELSRKQYMDLAETLNTKPKIA